MKETPPEGLGTVPQIWPRRIVSIVAGLFALACLLIAVASLGRGGWSNERTILYAAEGGLMSPRESLMQGLIFIAASLSWIVVLATSMGAAPSRARRLFRAAAIGGAGVLVLAGVAGGLIGDVAGMSVIGLALSLPLALLATVVRRWGRYFD